MTICNRLLKENGYDNVRVFYVDGDGYLSEGCAWNSVVVYDKNTNTIYLLDGIDVTIINKLIYHYRQREETLLVEC